MHHEVLPDRFKGPDAVAAGVFFAAQLVRPEVVAFIAEQDGEAVGYALAEELRRQDSAFTFARSTLYLHHLAVVGAARHRGIGRLLVATVDEEARRRGVDETGLDYWLFNSPARGFFGSLGYVPYSERARGPSTPGWATSSRGPWPSCSCTPRSPAGPVKADRGHDDAYGSRARPAVAVDRGSSRSTCASTCHTLVRTPSWPVRFCGS